MGRRVREVLDEVHKDQGAACAMEHRDLTHEAALHEHLIDLTGPVRGRPVTKPAIIFQAGVPSFDTGTDPRLRTWKGGLCMWWKFPGATIWATGPRAEISSAIAAVILHGECSMSWPEASRMTVIRPSNVVPASRTG